MGYAWISKGWEHDNSDDAVLLRGEIHFIPPMLWNHMFSSDENICMLQTTVGVGAMTQHTCIEESKYIMQISFIRVSIENSTCRPWESIIHRILSKFDSKCFKLIKRTQKWIPRPKFSVGRYTGHVIYTLGSKVMVLLLLVAAILEICKLGVFHPQETLGTFCKAWMV